MGIVTRVDTVWFSVKDMGQGTAFYRDVLGLEVVYESPYWTSLKAGDVQIGLHGDGGEGSLAPRDGWTVSLLTEDLRGLRQALTVSGVNVSEGYHDTPRGALLSFQDPEGNSLQAMQLGVKASEID